MSFGETHRSAQRSDSIAAATAAVRERIATRWPPDIRGNPAEVTAIVLGSGLGPLAEKIETPIEIAFDQIPGFAVSTAAGHRGQLLFGTLGGAPLIAMAGRLHRYEGWSNSQVSFPIEVMHRLGASRLIATNAAGGVNPVLRVGDLVVIRDHIDWQYRRPNATPARGRRGTDTSGLQGGLPNRIGSLYDRWMSATALSAARDGGFTAIEGTYLATLGPTYETRAEYRMMRRMGADVVGMSTVPEVLAAAKCPMPVLAMSIVSNVANPDRPNVADHAEVLEAGNAAAAKLERIVRRVICGSN
jgi:purine-nucleoside phosphorylase